MTDDQSHELAMNMKDSLERIKTDLKSIKNFIKRYDRLHGFTDVEYSVTQFIDAHCNKGTHFKERYTDLWMTYKNNNFKSISSIAFSTTLTNLGYLSKRTHNYRARAGLELKEPLQPSSSSMYN